MEGDLFEVYLDLACQYFTMAFVVVAIEIPLKTDYYQGIKVYSNCLADFESSIVNGIYQESQLFFDFFDFTNQFLVLKM